MTEKPLVERLDFEGWFWRQKEEGLRANPDFHRVARNTAELFEEAATEVRRLRSLFQQIESMPRMARLDEGSDWLRWDGELAYIVGRAIGEPEQRQ